MGKKVDAPHTEDADNSLASRLGRLLKSKDVNPNRVESETGIKRQTLYAVLQGKTQNFSWQNAVLLSSYFNCRPEWLQTGEGPMNIALVLKDEEAELVKNFRYLSPGHKRDLEEIARRWAEEDGEGDVPTLPHRPRIPRQ